MCNFVKQLKNDAMQQGEYTKFRHIIRKIYLNFVNRTNEATFSMAHSQKAFNTKAKQKIVLK